MSAIIATTVPDIDNLKFTVISMHQEVSDFDGEIIIVVDGGLDQAIQVENMKEWITAQGIQTNIEILSKEKSGLTKSLNFGIRHAQTDIIFRIDSGDIWLKGRIKKQLAALHAGHDLVATTGLSTEARSQTELLQELKFRNHIIHSSAAFKKSYYDEYYEVCQDYALWVRFMQEGKSIWLHSEPVCYRINTDNGISFQKTFLQLQTSFLIRKTLNLPAFFNFYLLAKGFIAASLSKVRLRLISW